MDDVHMQKLDGGILGMRIACARKSWRVLARTRALDSSPL